MKHLRGDVFRFGTIAHTADHIGVHTLEVLIVKGGEALGILLRRLDQEALVRFLQHSPGA